MKSKIKISVLEMLSLRHLVMIVVFRYSIGMYDSAARERERGIDKRSKFGSHQHLGSVQTIIVSVSRELKRRRG